MNPRGIDDRLDSVLPPYSEVERLKEEVEVWKAASKREATFGIALGGVIGTVVGIVIGINI